MSKIKTLTFDLKKIASTEAGKHVYLVADSDGNEIYKSAPTSHKYVAILGFKKGDAANLAEEIANKAFFR